MDKTINVLFVLPNIIQGNGVFAFCWNYLRYINYQHLRISIVTINRNPSSDFLKFCSEKQISIYFLPDPWEKGYFKHWKSVKQFFKEHHNFSIVHCNVPNYGFFYLRQSKKYGIPVRILHSHNTKGSDVFWKRGINDIGLSLSRRYATQYFACSQAAGIFAFKRRPFTVIHNAVDQKTFIFSSDAKISLREKLGIPQDAFVIGFVGRLDKQKNPLFLIQIFKQWTQTHVNSFCVLVGSGPMLSELQNEFEKAGLLDRVRFVGVVPNVSLWYSVFDVFVLPSLFEGLALSGVEAQSVGIPCVFSSGSSSEILFKKNSSIINLSAGPDVWCREIENVVKLPNETIPGKNNYDIRAETIKLDDIYTNSLKKN